MRGTMAWTKIYVTHGSNGCLFLHVLSRRRGAIIKDHARLTEECADSSYSPETRAHVVAITFVCLSLKCLPGASTA